MRAADLDAVVERLAGEASGRWPVSDTVILSVGLEPVAGQSSHLVCAADVDGTRCALKLFRSWERGEPDREWSLLQLLDGTGLAPRPVWRSVSSSRPAIVATWVDGRRLRGRTSLDRWELDAIADAHEAVRALPVPAVMPPALNSGRAAVDRILGWWPELPRLAAPLGLSSAVMARLVKEPFAATAPVARVVELAPRAVGRGDANLANYLVSGTTMRLVDFEDAGVCEPVFELADMIEHFANRSLPEATWEPLTRATEVNDDDVRTARGVVAEFWLALTIRRQARGLTMRPPITPDEQLDRLASLGVAPARGW